MKRPLLGVAALAATGVLTGLTMAPAAVGSHVVSQATGNALTASVAGNPAGSGTTTATNNGSGEVKTEPQPLLGALGGNALLNTGVLLQDASAVVSGQDGLSAACAGVAGQGGSLVNVGDSSCIQPGEAVDIDLGNLNLTGVELIDPASSLGALSALQPVIDSVLGPVTQAVSDGLKEPLEGLGIVGGLDAVAGYCEAAPGTASGESSIAGASLALGLPGMDPIPLVALEADGSVNQKVVTDPAALVAALSEALQENFAIALDGQLSAITDPLFTQVLEDLVVNTVLSQVQTALAPVLEQLEANILDITINKQSPVPATDRISVTALDIQVLPAAQQAIGSSLIGLSIGNVTCGPNSRIHAAPVPPTPPTPQVPTAVNSGATGAGQGDDLMVVAGGLIALAGAAGAIGYRRFAAR